MTVRLIDTRGIGDTRGIEKDKDNFRNILHHIATFDKLHGICKLLKPKNSRLNIAFEYCIKEMLANLHNDTCRNIMFCFTNSQSTFYMPGDTMPALKKLLTDNKVNISVARENTFCVDNESVRYLASVKSRVTFEKQRQYYSDSWKTSLTETERLMKHIASVDLHYVRNTLSVNDARHMILCFTKPIAEITVNHSTNQKHQRRAIYSHTL